MLNMSAFAGKADIRNARLIIAVLKGHETAMKVVGIIGLCLIMVGIVMAIGLVAVL